MKVVRLSALHIGRLYPQEDIPGTHLCYRLIRPLAVVRPEGICQEKVQKGIWWGPE
jgi:hypothetical protein